MYLWCQLRKKTCCQWSQRSPHLDGDALPQWTRWGTLREKLELLSYELLLAWPRVERSWLNLNQTSGRQKGAWHSLWRKSNFDFVTSVEIKFPSTRPEWGLIWREMQGVLQPEIKTFPAHKISDRTFSITLSVPFDVSLLQWVHLLAKSATARAAWRVNWSLKYWQSWKHYWSDCIVSIDIYFKFSRIQGIYLLSTCTELRQAWGTAVRRDCWTVGILGLL